MFNIRIVPVLVAIILASACGGGSSSPTPPTSPSNPTPPAQQNRAPVINSINVTPSFGVSELTSFVFSASASDADGDTVSYSWDLASNPRSGSSGSITFVGSGVANMSLTVTDGKGGSATDSRTVTVGTMTGNWSFFVPGQGTLLLALSQNSTFVTGSFTVAPGGFGNVAPGVTGRTDPAQPGSIGGNAAVQIRLKVGPFTDFTMNGTMDSSGTRITGSITGSGFSGQPFTMTKQ